MKKLLSLLSVATIISGCATTTPPSNVHQPMSVRPPAQPMQTYSQNGSIFPSYAAAPAQGNYRPLFEDYRARNVGDTITIVLNERTTASSTGRSAADRKSEISAGITAMNKIPGSNALNNLNIAGTSDNTFSGGGNSSANNAFNGNITVTVIEILPNGNMLVSGEKIISINHGDEYIRFSGIINPTQILSGNMVSQLRWQTPALNTRLAEQQVIRK